ncbi:MAG TPA: phosphoadenylyl-sulfate reductase [Gordonia sp. (in: high G+C Gram-positive bacteria)]|uniref:phosphoadenylyl-sulfate reductase n=1 Tax=unclassified Gordonia (in: high G+C Gram-positive bacteria) TaxID=2657482 RepID=UPI000F9AACD9|nr:MULTISPECIES: phosphoadenylyl-sulfate reductase [unclassified Gordonia (in: high G+C Gram-positive bacteria)]RUP41592.1 MAG: phosphoadenylyl-sulfate reductase [Gordonia sp. (in: high G+C Gram-positive bacteria)]HNP58557.1 phosphoadenylyl-sulfate reductase [Gordonia sp. (in: high G+C Gram-positive bacteria)]HRC52176.1 phosphoadenylyl-sulfate reductase [Gordonia sp. (in: high G+C Gram-positive bacteria)]
MTTTIDTDHLRGIAERGAAELGPDATADELLRWTAETFGTDFLIAANMQDAVLIDVADKAIDRESIDNERLKVLFLDTGYHFAETIGTRDAVVQVYDLELLNVLPEHTVAQQDELLGKDLFARNPAECCRLRKVVPLRAALSGFSAWVTGIRRVEAPTRANAPLISFDEGFGLVKINPLAAWSDEEFGTYIETHGVLVNPLVDEGYPSIGCAPCTAKPAIGADPRSGRWAGSAKTECGLHVS